MGVNKGVEKKKAEAVAQWLSQEGADTYGELRMVNETVLKEAGLNTFERLRVMQLLTEPPKQEEALHSPSKSRDVASTVSFTGYKT